jgi:hypothetical protein
VDDILGEQNALELDQEKVQQLGKILQDNLLGLLGNGVVAARAERAGNALLEDELTGNLNGSGHCMNGSACLPSDTHGSRDQLTAQRHVQELEGPAEKRQITSGENETNHGSIRNGGRTRLFPLSRSKRRGQKKKIGD